jgi:hypothetical protein
MVKLTSNASKLQIGNSGIKLLPAKRKHITDLNSWQTSQIGSWT